MIRSAAALLLTAMAGIVPGSSCSQVTPSQKLREDVHLPRPTAVKTPSQSVRLGNEGAVERYVLTPASLIPIAFNRQPDIKSSYQRFKSEEGRYDFFYTSRDSLTPQLSVSNTWDEDEWQDEDRRRIVDRSRDHTTRLGIEKRFFDTTSMDMGVGYRVTEENQGYGDQPFVSANLRYPLWGSRERLERTSEEIFRRNELNDTQLTFIQTVRQRLDQALIRYYDSVFQIRLRANARGWQKDLEALLPILEQAKCRDVETDRGRLEAEIASVRAQDLDFTSQAEVQLARLKSDCGLPFNTEVELAEEEFDPFLGMTHHELLRQGIETDPEIATLKNAMKNAQVQLDLARRGKWDVSLLANGVTDLEGRGTDRDQSDWSVSLGMEVSAVDDRVTSSLIRQASADIERFSEAIAARENAIYVNTLEPLVRNRSLAKSNDKLREGLRKYEQDFKSGIDEYVAGTLNLDDLITRRRKIFEQQEVIARQSFYMGVNTSSLCAATGKFFELLNGKEQSDSAPSAKALRSPASAGT
ncbi:MAG: hypothetical protein ABII12_01155 [Planctomycetota bacterium]